MNRMELLEVESYGPKYTWRGTQYGKLVKVRLDWGLVNQQWFDCWPNTCVINRAVVGLDHNPVIVIGDPFLWEKKTIVQV